eukprot:gb/GECG01000557.1/.p1 GENE.gb/GECG01000557.1/~~gb/GECG01000557.1/.p1  ORF type:complete len:342 (+),score=42.47 gb/GECG01000557.1/:1-1026(+)
MSIVRVGLVSKIRHLQDAVQKAIGESSAIQSMIHSNRIGAVRVEPIDLPDAFNSEQELPVLDYEIILADPAHLAEYVRHNKCPQLRWCQSTFAGVDPLVKATQAPSFVCTKLGDVFGTIMAEYVIGHIIAWVRQFSACHEAQKRQEWIQSSVNSYKTLESLTVGVLGAGNIGQEVLHKCSALGMSTIGVHSSESSKERARTSPCPYEATTSVDHALQHSDVIVNLLPSTPQTKYLLNPSSLSKAYKGERLLINAGRGDIIKEDDIVTCLNEGLLQHCVLDVFEKEPLPKDSVLWHREDVTVTPHVAAVSLPEDTANAFVANLEKWFDGTELQFKIDWSKGY